jgi:hypothetical protein
VPAAEPPGRRGFRLRRPGLVRLQAPGGRGEEPISRARVRAGIPGPEKNDRLFDVWQEYGALVANPETGGAIWRVRVQAEGFDQVLTLLCFPLEKLYPIA